MRYFTYVFSDINKYNVKELYEGFLIIDELLGTEFMDMNEIVISLDHTRSHTKRGIKGKRSISGNTAKILTLKYKQLIKYLFMHNLITLSERIDIISYLDDLETFLYLNIDTHDFYQFIENNSINILRYIFEHKLWDVDMLEESVSEIYVGDDIPDLKTTKLVFDYIENDYIGNDYIGNDYIGDDFSLILRVMMKITKRSDVFDYLMGRMPDTIDGDILYKELIDQYLEGFGAYETFKIIWHKWSYVLTDKQIIESYDQFFVVGSIQMKKIITFLAILPVIQKHYYDYYNQ